MNYLAIDIGASSGRHIIGSVNNGELETKEIYRFKNGVEEQNGKLVWDAQKLFAHIVEGIKRAKEFLASYDANMVATGKLNPVPYIFRAKNYYGMRDQQEYVLTPNHPLDSANVDEVANKYKLLPDE